MAMFMEESSLNNSSACWYLIQCKPQQEHKAKLNLEHQDFKIFLPEVSVSKKSKSGYITAPSILFPGYLFIELDTENNDWSCIRSTRGVSKLVSFGSIPAKVPSIVINELQHQSLINKTDDVYPFIKGEQLTISMGPFKDLQAIFDSRNGQQRSWIFLELMGKWQRLTINDIELSKVA